MAWFEDIIPTQQPSGGGGGGMFDDLIPAKPAPAQAGGGMFDDLIPPKEDVTAGMALRGIPVLGAYVPQAEAAIRAAAHPLTGVGKPGETFSERYAANLPEREAQYRRAEEESPITSGALQVGGGLVATAPLAATAVGGRLLGATGSLPSRLAAGASSGAALSAADTAARGGSTEDVIGAAKTGGAIGAAAPVVAGAVTRAISPFVSRDPTRAARVATLRQEGVQPTAGDVTGNPTLRWTEQHLGEIAGVSPAERTAERFTQAALRRTGTHAPRATPEVVDDAFTRIGQQFDDLAARNTLVPDTGMGPQIRHAVAEYDRLVSPPNRAPAIRKYEQEIGTALAQNRGALPGDVYQSLRSRMETDARNAGQDFNLANALRGMRSGLDDAMERMLARQRSPDLGVWRETRNQYRNLLVIERAVLNPNTRLGLITPAALYQATKSVHGGRNLARGRGDFAEFARAGSDILRPLPSSGTAQRAYVMGVPAALGAAYGGLSTPDEGSTLMRAAAGAAAPYLAGRAVMSPLMQRYLANQAMAGRSGQALRGGVMGGLLSLQ